ncbi:5-azacytidine-induced protein 1 [Stylonychia lemnae]|uniref:5-azacytidine-induced protein 1 n=1 Tax=Stylonychia lemnae TaxID=5949 RepID=A0A078ARU0_STYLE|nr:5-azacytidine-induced protein 1 [Stylonychia lemnae]|eukprot:CDW83907.1 5-azacytidine-induced protein 1 [Stylonychia lemnae]
MNESDLVAQRLLIFLEQSKEEFLQHSVPANLIHQQTSLSDLIIKEKELELKFSKSQIEHLKIQSEEAINDQKEKYQQEAEEIKRQMVEKLEKSLNTIENLIKDKSVLQGKVEDQHSKIKTLQQTNEKIKLEMQETYFRDLKKEKEQWQVQEKIRKEKWEQEKRQEIKQGTFQQLQPTIQSILDKNKEDMRNLQEQQQEELKQQRDIICSEYEKKIEQLRLKYIEEKEESLLKLRQRQQEQLQAQFEQFQYQFEEERKRLRESQFIGLLNNREEEFKQLQIGLEIQKSKWSEEKLSLLRGFKERESGYLKNIQELKDQLSQIKLLHTKNVLQFELSIIEEQIFIDKDYDIQVIQEDKKEIQKLRLQVSLQKQQLLKSEQDIESLFVKIKRLEQIVSDKDSIIQEQDMESKVKLYQLSELFKKQNLMNQDIELKLRQELVQTKKTKDKKIKSTPKQK